MAGCSTPAHLPQWEPTSTSSSRKTCPRLKVAAAQLAFLLPATPHPPPIHLTENKQSSSSLHFSLPRKSSPPTFKKIAGTVEHYLVHTLTFSSSALEFCRFRRQQQSEKNNARCRVLLSSVVPSFSLLAKDCLRMPGMLNSRDGHGHVKAAYRRQLGSRQTPEEHTDTVNRQGGHRQSG